MHDANLEDFRQRTRRIAESRRAGPGFAAYGMSSCLRAAPRPIPTLRVLLVVLVAVTVLKGAVLLAVGAPTYADRVAMLGTGPMPARALAGAMTAGPLTILVADGLRALVR